MKIKALDTSQLRNRCTSPSVNYTAVAMAIMTSMSKELSQWHVGTNVVDNSVSSISQWLYVS